MGIYDVQCMFSDDQGSLTTSVASTNIIDLGSGFNRNIGPGEPIKVEVRITADMTESANTITCSLQTDDNASFSSATTLASSAATALSSLEAGDKIVVVGTVPDTGVERYLRMYYTLSATTAGNVGTLQAALVLDTQTN